MEERGENGACETTIPDVWEGDSSPPELDGVARGTRYEKRDVVAIKPSGVAGPMTRSASKIGKAPLLRDKGGEEPMKKAARGRKPKQSRE